jgi:hypothetical protein
MDIFKLIFHHDLLVEQLEGADQNRTIARDALSLEDFMKPMPTYSRFYLSGTALDREQFALSALTHAERVNTQLNKLFLNLAPQQFERISFINQLEKCELNAGFIIKIGSKESYTADLSGKEYVREYGSEIKKVIEKGDIAVFKVSATHGYDIQLFCMKNIYADLFYGLKTLLSTDFRLYSINGKRLTSDRIFYFETYALNKLPHGVEEVFSDTVY